MTTSRKLDGDIAASVASATSAPGTWIEVRVYDGTRGLASAKGLARLLCQRTPGLQAEVFSPMSTGTHTLSVRMPS